MSQSTATRPTVNSRQARADRAEAANSVQFDWDTQEALAEVYAEVKQSEEEELLWIEWIERQAELQEAD